MIGEAPNGDDRRLLDPRAISLGRVSSAAVAGPVAIGSLITLSGILIASFPGAVVAAALVAGWLVLVTALALWLWRWPRLRYRNTWYRLDEQGMEIRRGVLWRSEVSVPRSRVQHTDVTQGPVERMFELATLILYTAGTEHASISLAGLEQSTARRLRDHLIQGGADDAV